MRIQEIWEDVLHLRPIGVTENFYHLGGHSLAAIRVASTIEDEFGRSDSLARIMLEAPTIERLADLLRSEESVSQRDPVVALQKSGSAAPFFCVHPAGGNVAAYAHLSERLGSELPFYGLDTLDGEVIREGVHAVAVNYLQRIRPVQQHGPYRLGGWSFGGLVAYDMATQLVEAGEHVELLALFDTGIPSTLSLADNDDARARLFMRCALYVETMSVRPFGLHLSDLQGVDQNTRIQIFMAACERSGLVTSKVGEQMVYSILESFHDCVTAASTYSPPTYHGNLVIYRASDELPLDAILTGIGLDDNVYGWSSICTGRVESVAVPGNHLTLLSPPHVDEVAKDLACRLKATAPNVTLSNS
jgi:thioesterase domain-containing protein